MISRMLKTNFVSSCNTHWLLLSVLEVLLRREGTVINEMVPISLISIASVLIVLGPARLLCGRKEGLCYDYDYAIIVISINVPK